MLPADFEGIAEALKGKNIKIKALNLHTVKITLMLIQTPDVHQLNLRGD